MVLHNAIRTGPKAEWAALSICMYYLAAGGSPPTVNDPSNSGARCFVPHWIFLGFRRWIAIFTCQPRLATYLIHPCQEIKEAVLAYYLSGAMLEEGLRKTYFDDLLKFP